MKLLKLVIFLNLFLFTGCFNKPLAPKETFNLFVKACENQEKQVLKELLTAEAYQALELQFESDYGSFNQGLINLAKETQAKKPSFLRQEPLKRHLIERVYYKALNEEDYLDFYWINNQWQISLKTAPILNSKKALADLTIKKEK